MANMCLQWCAPIGRGRRAPVVVGEEGDVPPSKHGGAGFDQATELGGGVGSKAQSLMPYKDWKAPSDKILLELDMGTGDDNIEKLFRSAGIVKTTNTMTDLLLKFLGERCPRCVTGRNSP